MWVPNETINLVGRRQNKSLLDFATTATAAKSGLDICAGEKDTVEMAGQNERIA